MDAAGALQSTCLATRPAAVSLVTSTSERIGIHHAGDSADSSGPAAQVPDIAVRLILGNDHTIFLDALSAVLVQRGFEVGAVARSPEEMIAHVRHQRPDACLIDCNPAQQGIESIRAVIEASETTAVVVLGADPDAKSAELAMEAGAAGYLHQSRGVEVLVSALERIRGGERVVDVPEAPPAGRAGRASHADMLAAALTGRERECLSLLVAGLDTAAMVSRMGVSRTTVRTHLQAVLTKLCVHSRLEAASYAVRHRLVDAWAEPAQLAVQATVPAQASGAVLDRPRRLRAVSGRRPEPAWQRAVGLAASG